MIFFESMPAIFVVEGWWRVKFYLTGIVLLLVNLYS